MVPNCTLFRQTIIVKEDDGKEHVIVDSFDIASYLEKTFATSETSLFSPAGNASVENVQMGKSYARFVEHWVNINFANAIRPALLAPVGGTLFADFGS